MRHLRHDVIINQYLQECLHWKLEKSPLTMCSDEILMKNEMYSKANLRDKRSPHKHTLT